MNVEDHLIFTAFRQDPLDSLQKRKKKGGWGSKIIEGGVHRVAANVPNFYFYFPPSLSILPFSKLIFGKRQVFSKFSYVYLHRYAQIRDREAYMPPRPPILE